MPNIEMENEMNLTNFNNYQEHLKAIVRHDLMLREGGKNVRKNSTDNVAEKSKTWTRTISILHVYLQYILAFYNFEMRVKPN